MKKSSRLIIKGVRLAVLIVYLLSGSCNRKERTILGCDSSNVSDLRAFSSLNGLLNVHIDCYEKDGEVRKLVFFDRKKHPIKTDTLIATNLGPVLLSWSNVYVGVKKLLLYKVTFIKEKTFVRCFLIAHGEKVYLCSVLKRISPSVFERKNINTNFYSFHYNNILDYCHSFKLDIDSKYFFRENTIYKFFYKNNLFHYSIVTRVPWGDIVLPDPLMADKSYGNLFLDIDNFDDIDYVAPNWMLYPPPTVEVGRP